MVLQNLGAVSKRSHMLCSSELPCPKTRYMDLCGCNPEPRSKCISQFRWEVSALINVPILNLPGTDGDLLWKKQQYLLLILSGWRTEQRISWNPSQTSQVTKPTRHSPCSVWWAQLIRLHSSEKQEQKGRDKISRHPGHPMGLVNYFN